MLIYLFVIILITFYHYISVNKTERYGKSDYKYIFYICLIFVMLAALRWIVPGTDIEGYMGDYVKMQISSFRDLWANWHGNYIVYYSICKIFSFTSLPYQFWFAFVQLVIVSGFVRMINYLSSDRIICLLLYFTVGVFTFSITGLKQALAMGFVWHSYACMCNKNYLWTIIFSILAFYSHKTSVIFMLSFVLLLLQNRGRFYTYVASIAIILITILPSQVLSFMTNYLGDEHYLGALQSNNSYSYTTLLFFLLLFSIAFFSRCKEYKNSTLIITMAAISVALNLFSQVVSHAFRLALYYTPFLIIMVSNRVKNRCVIYIVILIVSFYMLYTNRSFPYKFFWQ